MAAGVPRVNTATLRAECYFDKIHKRRCSNITTHVFFMFELPIADVTQLRLPNLYDTGVGDSWVESPGTLRGAHARSSTVVPVHLMRPRA